LPAGGRRAPPFGGQDLRSEFLDGDLDRDGSGRSARLRGCPRGRRTNPGSRRRDVGSLGDAGLCRPRGAGGPRAAGFPNRRRDPSQGAAKQGGPVTVGDFMTEQDFDVIRRLLRERSAIVLEAGKEYLVETRLAPLVRELDLNSIGELIAQLRSQPGNG